MHGFSGPLVQSQVGAGKVVLALFSRIRRKPVPPAQERIVVVRTRVQHEISGVVMRQERVAGVVAEGELKHRHAGASQRVDEVAHVLRDDAKVLGHQRQRTEPPRHAFEKREARTCPPRAVQGGFFSCGNLPVGRKPTKMVQPHDVHLVHNRFEAAAPPCEIVFLHRLPAVRRIVPALPGLAEIIGRNAPGKSAAPVLVQAKKMRMRPHVRAVVRYVNGNIAK